MNTGQVMVIVGINAEGVPENDLNKMKSDVVEFFTRNEGKNYEITSLYVQTFDLK